MTGIVLVTVGWTVVALLVLAFGFLFMMAVADNEGVGWFFRRLWPLMLATVVLVVMLAPYTTNTSPGTGEKVGNIVKLSRVGLLCPTYEGQLIRGGFVNGSGVAGTEPFDFTVEDTTLLPAMEQAMRNNAEVRLSYRTEAVVRCRSESDNHFATAVEVLR